MAADTVTTLVVFSQTNARKYVAHLTGLSNDGTGESAVVKIDRSALKQSGRTDVTKLKIASCRWNIQGYSYIKLAWDHTADDTALLLSGNGYDNWETYGCLVDPNTSGDTVTGAIGDLILTSVGAANGATYDITLELIL